MLHCSRTTEVVELSAECTIEDYVDDPQNTMLAKR